ncbi:MAG: hypothetical protein AAGA20_22505, partial [Planctomycetota bacterium]
MTDAAPKNDARERFAARVLELDAVLEVIAAYATSRLGRRAVLSLEPRGDDEARRALARVDEMLELLSRDEEPPMGGVSDPLPAHFEGRLDEDRIAALRDFLDANVRLREWTGTRAEEIPECAALLAASPDTRPLVERIERIVDGRGRVRNEASGRLGRLRETISSAAARVESALRGIMARPEVRASLSDGGVHRRAGRPVLAVKAKMVGRVRGLVHDRSQSGESVFVEPNEVVELGNRLAEARADERREVERILVELSRELLQHRSTIDGAAVRVGELEVSLAAARWGRRVGARPALQPGDDGASEGLLLRGARHPLLIDQVAREEIDDVVPIDLRLGVDFDMLL